MKNDTQSFYEAKVHEAIESIFAKLDDALHYDDPETTPASELQSDAAITVREGVLLPHGVSEIRVAAARYARTTWVGPYTGLGDAWAELLGGWLPRSGHRVVEAPSFDLYRNTPGQVPPERLCTELYLPIA